MPDRILFYGKPTCPMVAPVRLALQQADADYEYINILGDPQAKTRLREINGGHEGVPTLEFPDGSTLTEPSATDVKDKLRAIGYDIRTPSALERLQAFIASPLALYAFLLVLVFGALSGNNTLVLIGAGALGLKLATNLLWARSSASSKLERGGTR